MSHLIVHGVEFPFDQRVKISPRRFSGALTKHYGIKDVQQLETTWKKAALATARGQGE